MKKLFFSLAALIICCTGIQAANVKVTVKMNSTSPWMSLVDKVTQDTVAVGDADSQTYTFDVPDGTYVLTAYAKDSATVNGTVELNVSKDSTEKEFSVLTNTVYATNKSWAADKDYTVSYEDNVYVNTEAKVVINFMGNYDGTFKKWFKITQDPSTTEFDGEWVTVPKE